MIPVEIKSGNSATKAKVTSSGQLVVGPLSYDVTEFNTLDVINTAYNYFKPLAGKQFVITTIVVFADKDIANNSATEIVIYEADAPDTTTPTKILLQFGMGQLTTLPIVPLNLLINKGKFVNAKTNDDDIHMTIMGYYIDAL
jgi:hypothetical protein